MRLIDADELVRNIDELSKDAGFYRPIYEWFSRRIKDAPTIDAVPVVHGRWEEKFFTNDRQRVCSVCHCTVRQPSYDKGETALFKYCPNCGARMDGE